MTSRRPPCAVSLVGDNFALLSGRRGISSGGLAPERSGHADAAECDGTSRPRVKREKPATATRTVTRLPPFLPPGVSTDPFGPIRRVTFRLPERLSSRAVSHAREAPHTERQRPAPDDAREGRRCDAVHTPGDGPTLPHPDHGPGQEPASEQGEHRPRE